MLSRKSAWVRTIRRRERDLEILLARSQMTAKIAKSIRERKNKAV